MPSADCESPRDVWKMEFMRCMRCACPHWIMILARLWAAAPDGRCRLCAFKYHNFFFHLFSGANWKMVAKSTRSKLFFGASTTSVTTPPQEEQYILISENFICAHWVCERIYAFCANIKIYFITWAARRHSMPNRAEAGPTAERQRQQQNKYNETKSWCCVAVCRLALSEHEKSLYRSVYSSAYDDGLYLHADTSVIRIEFNGYLSPVFVCARCIFIALNYVDARKRLRQFDVWIFMTTATPHYGLLWTCLEFSQIHIRSALHFRRSMVS